ncbi:hypothetical protein AMTRI_Chr09g33030 [Amborella trichopoda]
MCHLTRFCLHDRMSPFIFAQFFIFQSDPPLLAMFDNHKIMLSGGHCLSWKSGNLIRIEIIKESALEKELGSSKRKKEVEEEMILSLPQQSSLSPQCHYL